MTTPKIALEMDAGILPELQAWFDLNIAAGCTVAQLRTSLLESGYRSASVDTFLSTQIARQAGALREPLPAAVATAKATSLAVSSAVAPADTAEASVLARYWQRSAELACLTRVPLGDRDAQVLARQTRQGIHFIQDVLTAEECAALVALAQPQIALSTVVDADSGSQVPDYRRTSAGAMLERGANELVQRIEQRLARLSNLPISHGEGLQVLHYRQHGEYRPHFDYFDPNTPGGQRVLSAGGQRLLTVILYLSDVEQGGGTCFPELALEFLPRKGAALMFPSIAPDGTLLAASLHAGLPVIAGEKWIATKWIRLRTYGSAAGD